MKTKAMKRRIPIFKVVAQPGDSYDVLKTHPQIKQIVIYELVLAIEEGIKKNKNKITLFEIHGSNCYLELDRSNWSTSLHSALDYFIELENYDKCIEIRELLTKI